VKKYLEKTPIVLLELFSGIGSGIVALKKLGIAIKTVITVEHDSVAHFVYKYNCNQNDSIEHLHVEKLKK
jgi:site-specific DNA-cytosine methylase